MNRYFIASLLFFIQMSAFASPGDDIWDHIKLLKNEVGRLKIGINNLGESQNNLSTQLSGQQNQIAQLTQEINVLKSKQMVRHRVGEAYHGGIIFYVDETGQHGLIASRIDASEQGVQWRNGESGNKVTNARSDGIGSGENNTRLIISQQTVYDTKGNFAALQASKFQVMDDGITPCKTPIALEHICYGGWYLPSAYELQLMHQSLHQNNLSSFALEYYWTSTESSVSNAWLINFSTGEITANSKSNTLGRVRPISRF